MSLVVIVAELDGDLVAADRARVLEALLANDVASMREMLDADVWQRVDRGRLEATLAQRDVDLGLRASPDVDVIEARLMIWRRHCSAIIYVPGERFPDVGPGRARQALAALLETMPARAIGSIIVPDIASPFEHESGRFHRELGLGTLLPPFQELAWVHALPAERIPHHPREILLGMPAEVVERDGRTWIQLWDAPLAYDTPTGREQIQRARDYLQRRASYSR